ncbi:MAG: hypothetical protein HZA68_05105 [Rhodovulum sp.]|nr:hypothetical protein [Rhodovulum sp.]
MTIDPDTLMAALAGYVLALTIAVAALAVATERAIGREGAETLRRIAVVRTRLGALVAVATEARRAAR